MSTVESLQACMKQEDALITEFAAILEAETEVLVVSWRHRRAA